VPHSKQADGFDHVTTDSQVRELVDRLARHPFLAFDTEFVSEHTYRSQLCLVQVAAPSGMGWFRAINPGLADNVGLGWTSDAPSLKVVGVDTRFALERVVRRADALGKDLFRYSNCVPGSST
jgi:hypothetical protein